MSPPSSLSSSPPTLSPPPSQPASSCHNVAKTKLPAGLDIQVLGALLTKIPLILRAVLLHILHLSPQARYLDLRTALVVAVLRSFLQPSRPRTISSAQKLLNVDPGVKGRIWVAAYASLVPPEPGAVRVAVRAAVEGLLLPAGGKGSRKPRRESDSSSASPQIPVPVAGPVEEQQGLVPPEVVPVEAEWTGYRAGATEESRMPPVSERQKYNEMLKETTSPAVVLYLHGGAFCLMDPATHRPTTKKLARVTGGCVYSVRYRLAPQHAFPAALMDAFVSYLTLLYPPPGAFHEPVKPKHLVLAGESAGGNLCLALIQLLLELRRQHEGPGPAAVLWHGTKRELVLPAGVAVSSPWCDMTHSMPSCAANGAWDYIPVSLGQDSVVRELSSRPPCEAWPTKPPRGHLYAGNALLAHPLVTVMTAPLWAGAPPVYICVGWELLADEVKYVAAKLHADGVPVVFEEYEAMPHWNEGSKGETKYLELTAGLFRNDVSFAMIITHLRGSRRCFDAWGGFIRAVAGDGEREPAKSRFVTVKAKTLQEVQIDVEELSPCAEEVMRERVARRVRLLSGSADASPKL